MGATTDTRRIRGDSTKIRGARRHGLLKKAATYAAVAVCVLLLWQVGVASMPSAGLLPSPVEVVQAFVQFRGLLLDQAWITIRGGLSGFVLALCLGIILAAVFQHSQTLRRMLWPAVFLAEVTPKVVMIPLILAWVGFGVTTSAAASAIMSFFPILLNAIAGFASVPSQVAELADSMRMSRIRYFWVVESRSALPEIFTGAKIAVNLSLVGALLAEYLGVGKGLGYVMASAQQSAMPALLFAAVVLIVALTLVLFGIVAMLERIATPWRSQRFKTERD